MSPVPQPAQHRKHVFKGKKSKHDKAKAGAGFDFPCTSAGTTGPVTVYYQTSLGAQGVALAQRCIAMLPAQLTQLANWFDPWMPPTINLLICDLGGGGQGGGGAYHYGCQGTDLYCDAAFSTDETLALFVAEAAEVAMAALGKGWDCGASPGEGLSRLAAEMAYPGVLDAYTTAAAWLDGSRTDWVNNADPTDTNPESTGCAVLALFWALSQGATMPMVCQASGSTIAAALSSVGLMAAAFLSAVASTWPPGTPSGVTSDNPWTGGSGGGGGGGGGGGVIQAVLHLPATDIPCTISLAGNSAAGTRQIDSGALLQVVLQLLNLLLGQGASGARRG